MTWDSTWEKVFQSRAWGRYPPEELIRFVARNYFSLPRRREIAILEIGCGGGANVWFLAREGFDVTGLDGSPSALEQTRRRLAEEGLSARLHEGDALSLGRLFSPARFDAVVDVACLQCNELHAVESIVKQAHALLKPGGRIFSMMVARGSYGEGLGTPVEPGTYVDIREGPLAGRGRSHFFSLEEVENLFRSFSPLTIETSARSLEGRAHTYAQWVVEGMKAS